MFMMHSVHSSRLFYTWLFFVPQEYFAIRMLDFAPEISFERVLFRSDFHGADCFWEKIKIKKGKKKLF